MLVCKQLGVSAISIHAPRAGRDDVRLADTANTYISIHAPRAGRDDPRDKEIAEFVISIHAPRAGRDLRQAELFEEMEEFQSTRPVRGATGVDDPAFHQDLISIHAPRAGRDSKSIQNYFTHFCDKRQFLDNFTQNAAF